MTVKNSWFVPAEISGIGLVFTHITHAQVNEWLQTVLIFLTIIATLVGIWRTLKSKK